ncbi:MAG: glycoside hydrolase family 3 protein [Turicibacter sp.]
MKQIRIFGMLLCFTLIACSANQINTDGSHEDLKEEEYSAYLDASLAVEDRLEDLMNRMSLDEKVAQMVQGERKEVQYFEMGQYKLGSLLSGGGSHPKTNSIKDWQVMISAYQNATLDNEIKVPMLYGIDAVHGHNNVYGATIFPHNIGLGAANDVNLMEKMGEIVGQEMLLTGIPWNFAPTVALATDGRWGRTYESFSSDAKITTELASSYAKGLMNVGVLPTIKHYVGDGATIYGTGLDNKLDRGDVQMSLEELRDTHLVPYIKLIQDDVPIIMASYSSFEGLLMHEHKYLLTDILKDELSFDGFVVSDWEAIHAIQGSFYQQVVKSVNAGIDMLMEPNQWKETYDAILKAVKNNDITEDRINDAVSRILKVKFEMGLFEDPTQFLKVSEDFTLRNEESRDVARQLVEKSSVLLKNNQDILPLKKDQLIYLTGPGANNIGMQCGGWTIEWQGAMDNEHKLTEGITIYEGLKNAGFNVTMDSEVGKDADVVLMVIGEKPYTEMFGDVEYADLYSSLAVEENKVVIEEVKNLNKPTVALLLAGRHLDISEEINLWDAAIMSYLPGTEGDGIVNLLAGSVNFTGKLASPWDYTDGVLFEVGYGLAYD